MVQTEDLLNWENSQNQIRLNPRWPSDEANRLRELAKLVTAEQNLAGHLWIATSGSSASSISQTKLVALSKQAFLNSAAAVNKHLQSTDKDIWAQALPLFHVGGIGIEARAFLSGARVVQSLADFKWDPQFFYQILQEKKCTLASLVPTQVYDLVQSQLSAPESLRAIVVGGGALSDKLYEAARKLKWPLLPSYGMTETCSQVATATLASLENNCPGLDLLSHAQVRTNTQGFLEFKANSLCTGYAQVGKGFWDPKHDGWLTSEDRGEVVGNRLRIDGRGQEFVKVGGELVSLPRLREKLEMAVSAADSSLALDVVLFDLPSERLGSEVHLVFTPRVSTELRQKIQELYNSKVLPFERIRDYHEVSALPRTELGKIRFAELRNLILDQRK